MPTIDPHEKITLIRNNTGIEDSGSTQYDGVNGYDGTTQWQANPTSIYDINVNKFDEHNVVVEFIGRETTPPANLIPRTRIPTMLIGGGDNSSSGGSGNFDENNNSDGDGTFNTNGGNIRRVNDSDSGSRFNAS